MTDLSLNGWIDATVWVSHGDALADIYAAAPKVACPCHPASCH
ncbi:conserved hypothetical protein [Thiomonas arsenitoxydans]|uniref:Uncharacterized protein n=1 Tax=Thiomonas arsenitoxydans (strain DSM 22701 / CIP 110005 / 3As) TaxID=426114 RepID=D6CV74_THIA3|nr:hypothetical protein THI_2574 [Thiomonas arsenitoxydans]CDW93034.1 conserved hypothetical protein [Thiomonas sp. CB2]CQR45384.1 conserved hypothetical protein [Thiomonas sp. CB3]VDY06445.1 conserved protein of unknown function [Thiomonas sp. Bio17B3]VDY10259.1 conserved protein of unknown function [Thiomonas sp. Sup16B3]VDY14717.1 hypothetical protein TOC7_31147 [Thiomonas sp. OC7]